MGQGRLLGGEHLGVAVYGRAACKHQAFDGSSLQGFEKALGGDDVVADVLVEVGAPARADGIQAGKVKDHGGAIDQRPEVSVHQVGLFELEGIVASRGIEVSLLSRAVVEVAEAIDTDYVMSRREQPLAQMRSDKSSCSGDDDLHGAASTIRVTLS